MVYGIISQELEPDVFDMPMNRMRRKFLRLLMSSQASVLGLGKLEDYIIQEQVMKMTDNELLKEWYWMNAMWTAKSPEEHRFVEFQEVLDEIAQMMATEAILYSEEELNIITNHAAVEANSAAGEAHRRAAAGLMTATEEDAVATAYIRAATERALEAAALNAEATSVLEAASRRLSTATGCGAQGTKPPDTQARDGTGGTKRRLPTNSPTRCPTRVTDETIIEEKTDGCATPPNDGATETTASNDPPEEKAPKQMRKRWKES